MVPLAKCLYGARLLFELSNKPQKIAHLKELRSVTDWLADHVLRILTGKHNVDNQRVLS